MGVIKQKIDRLCVYCKLFKQSSAYVGTRQVCRSCWQEMPKSQQNKYFVNPKLMANYRKKKALKQLNMLP